MGEIRVYEINLNVLAFRKKNRVIWGRGLRKKNIHMTVDKDDRKGLTAKGVLIRKI